MRKWPYLGPWASNCKNKTTLFSSIFKVEGNKVVLFFQFRAQRPRYGYFLFFKVCIKSCVMSLSRGWLTSLTVFLTTVFFVLSLSNYSCFSFVPSSKSAIFTFLFPTNIIVNFFVFFCNLFTFVPFLPMKCSKIF